MNGKGAGHQVKRAYWCCEEEERLGLLVLRDWLLWEGRWMLNGTQVMWFCCNLLSRQRSSMTGVPERAAALHVVRDRHGDGDEACLLAPEAWTPMVWQHTLPDASAPTGDTHPHGRLALH